MIISIADQLEYSGDRKATESSRRSSKCIELKTNDSIHSVSNDFRAHLSPPKVARRSSKARSVVIISTAHEFVDILQSGLEELPLPQTRTFEQKMLVELIDFR
jgi:hypothetical protein